MQLLHAERRGVPGAGVHGYRQQRLRRRLPVCNAEHDSPSKIREREHDAALRQRRRAGRVAPEPDYYELRKVTPSQPGELVIRTAAVLCCDLCGGVIDSMGGPGHGAVCVRCADVVMSGRARGAIKWDDRDDA